MNIQLYILNFSALRALHEKSFYFLIEKVIDELLTTTFQAHLLGLLGKTGSRFSMNFAMFLRKFDEILPEFQKC